MERTLELEHSVGRREIVGQRITPEEWSVYWPSISQELDTIPQYWADYWTKESINCCVMDGHWQAWGFGTSDKVSVVVLTQIAVMPANKFLQVLLAFGNNLDECLPMIEATMEKFAVVAECDMCEIVNGRPGWWVKLPRFRRSGVVLKCRVPKMGVH